MTPRQSREESRRRQAERTAHEMGKGGRASLVYGWLAEGRLKTHNAKFDKQIMTYFSDDPVVHLSVGDVWFDDRRIDFPSERLVANLALALQAGVDRK